MLDHKYRLIFVHFGGTGGTSIEYSFDWIPPYDRDIDVKFKEKILTVYGDRVLFSSGNDIDNALKHLPFIHSKKIYKEYWDDYFKFTFVRNPFDWMVSKYLRMKKTNAVFESKIFPYSVDYFMNMDFEEYVIFKTIKWGITFSKYVGDRRGNVHYYDYIGKYEKLEISYVEICNLIGKKYEKLPHIEKTLPFGESDKHYTEWYNGTTKDIMYKFYRNDLELFEYEF